MEMGSLTVNALQAQSYRVLQRFSGGDDQAWLFVNLHQRGRCRLHQNGREQYIEGQAVSLNVSTMPYEFTFGSAVWMLCLRLPLHGIAARAPGVFDAVARPLVEDVRAAMFLALAHTVTRRAAQLHPWEMDAVAATLLDLVALAVAPVRNARAARTGIRRELLRRACAYADLHFGRPDLSVADAAAHLRIAARTLQTVFQEHGQTFSQYVLERRLVAAEHQLRASASRRIGEIAYAVGFSDLSYFCRAFRHRHGMAPQAWRAQECAPQRPVSTAHPSREVR